MGISVNSKSYSVFGDKAAVVADLSFSGTYTTGGVAINCEQLFGLHNVEAAFLETQSGLSLVHDKTNNKIKIFSPAPPICYEEHLVLDSSYQCQTKYPATYFMAVNAVGENIKFRSTGIAKADLNAGECCLASQMASQTRTTLTVSPINQVTDTYSAIGVGTGWTAGTDWSFVAGKAVKAAGAGSGTLTLDETFPLAGHTYRVVYTVSSTTAGGFTMSIGGTDGTAVTADGTYTEDILAVTSASKLTFTPTTDLSAFSLDEIYVYDLDVYATYVTQAWKEVWDNLVQDEEITLATGANTLASGNKILACMYIDQTTATAAALTMIDSDDTVASGEVDLLFNSATSQFTVHAGQNAKAVKTTYIKVPSSGFLFDRMFSNETTTKEGTDPYLNIMAKPLLLWGYTGQLPVNGQTTQRLIDWASTPAAGGATIDWFNRSLRGHATTPTAAGASHNHIFTGTAVAPPIVVEEVVTVTSHTGTLVNVPLYITAIQVTAGGVTGAFKVIPTGETPVTTQCAVTFTTGLMTFLDTDAVTSCLVTYIPKKGSGYLSTVTVDESKVAAAAKVNLAARAGLIQYVWDDTDGVLCSIEQVGTEPSATHFVEIDINDAGNSSLDSHADDEGNTLKVTYVPYTQIPPGCFIDDTDITLNSEAWNFCGDPLTNGYSNLVVPGFGVVLVGETGAAARSEAVWQGPSGTAANSVATWTSATNSILTNQDTAMTIASIPWMILDLAQLTPQTPAGTNAAEATHTHAIAKSTAVGSIIDIKSNLTGTAAGVWGHIDEIVLMPLELHDGASISDLTSVKAFFIGA